MKKELKTMFEAMQDNLLDAENLTVYGGDTAACGVTCIQGCVQICTMGCPVDATMGPRFR